MITALEIYQSNVVGVVNVMACHNELIFLVDATYTDDAPNFIYCKLTIDGEQKVIARCVYDYDVSDSIRRFRFDASAIIRGYMPSFDDFSQEAETFIECTNISREMSLIFESDLEGTVSETLVIEPMHAARQIGENVNMSDLCLNGNEVFYCGENMPVYVYFYNAEAEPPSGLAYLAHDANRLVHNGDNLLGTQNI